MKSELTAAIESGDEQACVLLLKGQDERARRELYPAIARKVEEIDSALKNFSDPSRPQLLQDYTVARLAMLGAARLGELKELPVAIQWRSSTRHFDGQATELAGRMGRI